MELTDRQGRRFRSLSVGFSVKVGHRIVIYYLGKKSVTQETLNQVGGCTWQERLGEVEF